MIGRAETLQDTAIAYLPASPVQSKVIGREETLPSSLVLKPLDAVDVDKLLKMSNDGRVIIWVPAPLTASENDRLLDFAACRKLIAQWGGKDSDDASVIIKWVNEKLRSEIAQMKNLINAVYGRGRIDSLNNTAIPFQTAGELSTIMTPVVDRVLTGVYLSSDIEFPSNFIFRDEEAVKVINGLVKTGQIPPGAKPNKDISAALNFAFSLKLIPNGNAKVLDTSGNRYLKDIWHFVDEHLPDEHQTLDIVTIYKNFMGIGGPGSNNYGLKKRMVQLYLLCLVQQAKIKIQLAAKAGLTLEAIDCSNIATIDSRLKCWIT